MAGVHLFHISDLHFGEKAGLRARLGGQEAHDPEMVAALVVEGRDAARRAKEMNAEFHVVVTGDLTQKGNDGDFVQARRFLEAKEVNEHDEFEGLGLDESQYSIVLGNHDHWSGRVWVFAPLFNRSSSPLPSIRSDAYHVENGDLAVSILGVDSSAGWDGCESVIGRVTQSGRLTSDDLERVAKREDPELAGGKAVVRTLLHHHDVAPWPIDGMLFKHLWNARSHKRRQPWPLEPISRQNLIRNCQRGEVRIVLTGHRHDLPELELRRILYPEADGLKTHEVWELRSPTSSQIAVERARPGFLIHKIERRDEMIEWQFELRQWGGMPSKGTGEAGGFEVIPDFFEPIYFDQAGA